MNEFEKKMFLILKELKEENKELIVKADFEAEGTRIFELSSLAALVFKAGGKLYIKIGGCEAVLDLGISKNFLADAIMAPMVETSYALRKFKVSAKTIFKDSLNDVMFIANAETKTTIENFDEILKEGEGFLKGITIGRVDLASSIGLKRKDIDSKILFFMCETLAKKAFEKGYIVSVGGGILKSSFNFLEKLRDYIKRFETRKFIFDFDGDIKKFEKNIEKATEFELLYLKNKKNNYLTISKEDITRIDFLKERI